MEFIQCPHCQKQYVVSDKLRAAAGKKIRCKHCKQPFEIIVQTHSAPTRPEPEATLSEQKPSAPTATESKQAKSKDDDLFDLSKYNSESYFDFSETAQNLESKKDVALPGASEATAIDAPEAPTATDKDTKKAVVKAKPGKKPFNIQLLITIALAIALLIAAVAAYLFLTQPELFRATSKKAEKSIVTEALFKPIEIKIADPKPEPAIKEEPVRIAAAKQAEPMPKTAIKSTSHPKPEQRAAQPFKSSQVCKDVSAEYWVRSNRLATASLDTATYLKLLDQNLVQADEIRRACKDKKLVGIISKAARTDNRPDWIKQEINTVLDKTEAHKKRQTED